MTLLQEVASGNEAAFGQLFDHYRSNIYTTVLRMTGNEQIAEEILQDCFLKVWTKREQLPSLNNFGGWLFTIAANMTYNAIKSLKREMINSRKFLLNIYNDHFEQADDVLLKKEFNSLLLTAIDRLPEKQRQTYKLIKEQGLPRNEAAKILNVSPETVKWNLDQAMRSIRAFFIQHLPMYFFLFF